ncbi:MAG TPA: hypothetical protein VK894_13885 [Jiangellales bacterium]|nr:hypothetical protein [Jiangellales bacterium]
MAGKGWTGAVLAGLVVGGVMGIADQQDQPAEPPEGRTTTVVEQEVRTDTSDGTATVTEESATATDGPTAEAESNQFVEETDSGTVTREDTVTSSTDDG